MLLERLHRVYKLRSQSKRKFNFDVSFVLHDVGIVTRHAPLHWNFQVNSVVWMISRANCVTTLTVLLRSDSKSVCKMTFAMVIEELDTRVQEYSTCDAAMETCILRHKLTLTLTFMCILFRRQNLVLTAMHLTVTNVSDCHIPAESRSYVTA